MELYILRVDNAIDLITNSSSELFVIKGDKQKEMVIEMISEAFKNNNIPACVSEWSIESMVTREEFYYEATWEKENLKEKFPVEKHHLIEELYGNEDSNPNFYGYRFDRDSEYRDDIRDALTSIGFEYIGSDY